jgi:hypothetical protein
VQELPRIAELGYCVATHKWLSLHAAACVNGDDRVGFVTFLRYAPRFAVSAAMSLCYHVCKNHLRAAGHISASATTGKEVELQPD